MDTLTTVLAAASPFLLAVFTWLTRRGLEQRAAEETSLDKRLAQQREDFKAVVEPLKSDVVRLRDDNDKLGARVDDLDRRLDEAVSDRNELTYDFRRTLDHLDTKYNDPGPRRSGRVNELLGW